MWRISPASAIHAAERFKQPLIRHEVEKLIHLSPIDVVDVSEALTFLLGENLDGSPRKDLKVWNFASINFIGIPKQLTVPPPVGTGSTNHGEHALRAAIQQRSPGVAICSSRSRAAPGRIDVLLRSSGCTSPPS